MPTVIPVKFKYAARDLWFNPRDTGAQEGDHVICTTERGVEIGLATGDTIELSEAELNEATNNSPLKPVIRIATDEDLDRAEELADLGDAAMPAFRRLVAQNCLDMKPVGVEYLFGGDKVVCYFAAEDCVDFRQLVRDMSRELHERIDMRQIGVREEAAIVGGYGHCGQELCCRRFGLSFEPVSIRMAKEQDLPLNSTKISGACGRLMCCLRYEFEAYRDFKGRAPKRNAVIDTPLGKAKIVEYDTPKEQLALRIENGKTVRVNLADMTCSDAAHKKSEELGCACRPDTVTREVLDKLQSPDVQMALAELDRKNGVVPPEETFSEDDLFVQPKKRRRRGGSEDAAAQGEGAGDSQQRTQRADKGAGAEQAPAGGAQAQGEPGRRRRRKGGAAGAAEDAQVAAETSAMPAGQQRPRRDAQEAQHEGPSGMQPRRRRHHRAAGEGEGAQPQAGQTQAARHEAPAPAKGADGARAQGQDGAEAPRPRRRRKPGDHGGQQGQGGQQASRQQSPKQQAPRHMAPEGAADAAADADPNKPRRRRHRGGRGRGKGQGGEGQGQGGQGGQPAGGPSGE